MIKRKKRYYGCIIKKEKEKEGMMILQEILKKVKRSEEGFTLVELLIVVAIIAILAAIAIPQFTKYRLRAYKSEIDSDTKNAYTAAQAYLTDNPGGTVDSMTKLLDGGYQRSTGVSWVSGDMTLGTGSIVLKSTPLKSAAKSNNSTVFFNGRFSFVASP